MLVVGDILAIERSIVIGSFMHQIDYHLIRSNKLKIKHMSRTPIETSLFLDMPITVPLFV